MKVRRSSAPRELNPEKFIAHEKKKAAIASRPATGEIIPVRFSKERTEALITRVASDAFYLGSDPTKYPALMATWNREVTKELEAIGVVVDEMLVTYLSASIVNDPMWRRITRKRKNA